MRRRAVLVVEYGKENGRPLDIEDWIDAMEQVGNIQTVTIDVQEDRPA